MTYAQENDAFRRLKILQLLVEDGGQASDDKLITAMRAVGERIGLDLAAVRRMLRELEARDCLTIELVRDTVMVARITEHGRMAAAGDIMVGGVRSPFQGL